jgi:hypothetical protein
VLWYTLGLQADGIWHSVGKPWKSWLENKENHCMETPLCNGFVWYGHENRDDTHAVSVFYIMWNNLYLDCGSHGSSFVVHWLNPPPRLLLFWSFGVRLSSSCTSSSVGTWNRSSTFKRRADDLHCALAESSIQTSLIRMFDLCMNFMLHQSFPFGVFGEFCDSVNLVHWLSPHTF